MKETILVASHWLHLMASVIWIGGVAAIVLVVMPSGKKVPGGETRELMGEVSKRFTPLANASIAVLILTGLALTLMDGQSAKASSGRSLYPVLKHLLVSAMVIIHFYRGLILAPGIGKTTSEASREALQRLSLRLVKTNLIFAAAVLLVSAIVALP
jgi:uncharacterized membrane protein